MPRNLCHKCCNINVFTTAKMVGWVVYSVCFCVYTLFHFLSLRRIISFIIGKGESKLVSVDMLVELQLLPSILPRSPPTFCPFYIILCWSLALVVSKFYICPLPVLKFCRTIVPLQRPPSWYSLRQLIRFLGFQHFVEITFV